jgi:hypothetical protein
MCFAKYFNFLLWMGRGEGSVGSPDPRIISGGGGGERRRGEKKIGKDKKIGIERKKKTVLCWNFITI